MIFCPNQNQHSGSFPISIPPATTLHPCRQNQRSTVRLPRVLGLCHTCLATVARACHRRACWPPAGVSGLRQRAWSSPHMLTVHWHDWPLPRVLGRCSACLPPARAGARLGRSRTFFFTCANQCLASRFSIFHRFSRMGPFCILEVYSVPRNCSVPFILPTEYRNGR
jgi:hypothetical protein